MSETQVRAAEPGDLGDWVRLRRALLPDEAYDAQAWDAEMADMLGHRADRSAFVAERAGRLVGFIEVALRDHAAGCETSPVGFIEAWFVEPDCRRQGIGRLLVAAAEQWTLDQGCSEIGSDALLDNTLSHDAHRGLGYREAARLVAFAKRLHDP